MQKAFRCLLFLFLFMFSIVVSHAQTTQQFTGHVTDSTGAVIPDAAVVAHNQETDVDTKTVTTSAGAYTIPYLQPGTYNITVTKTGFKTAIKTDILLYIDQTSTMDFPLSVGSTTEAITVNASAAQIELSKSDRGEIIDAERIAELPLDSRNPYLLFNLSPGVYNSSSAQYPRPFDFVTDNMTANGAPQPISLSIDGITNDTGRASRVGFGTNPGIVPSVDSLSEFKVVLGAVDASYGQGAGNSMDLGFKTGTKRLHGVLDYYKRASWLDAYSFQSKYNAAVANQTNPSVFTAAIKPSHGRAQYSLEFDGPVVIPHLFNGKDKLFFTVSYEYMKDALPDNFYNYADIPNPAWVGGNFAGAQFWDGTTKNLQPLIIYDVTTPLTSIHDPNDTPTSGNKMAHAAFPGNVVPLNRMDPIGKAMLGYLAGITPNYDSGVGFTPWTRNWANLAVEHDIWKNGLVKVDYTMSDKDRLSIRWNGQARWQQKNNNPGWPSSATYYSHINDSEHQIQPKGETGSIQWTHTFSPNLLFDFHTTLMTLETARVAGPTVNAPADLAALGFPTSFASQIPNYSRFPYISWGGTNIGVNSFGDNWRDHALDFLPTLTYIHGQHSIRTGLDIQLQQAATIGGGGDQWNFTNNFTNEFYNSNEASGYTSGSAYASGLLGYMNDGTIPVNVSDFESQKYVAPWVQDDWKVTPKLTVNLGFRWDFQMPRTVRNNIMTGAFNTSVVNPIATGLTQMLVGGPTYAGVNGAPRTAYAMNRREWQPRIGFAYAIKPTLSVRGFIAKNYIRNNNINGTQGYSASTNYTNSVDAPAALGSQPYTIDDGFGHAPGLANPYAHVNQPLGSSQGYLSNIGNGWNWYSPKFQSQSLWNYSLILEAALTKRDVVSVSYVGNYSGDLPVNDNINHPAAAFYQQCNGEVAGWKTTLFGAAVPVRQICDNQTINNQFNNVGYIANMFKGLPIFNDGAGYYGNTNFSRADLTRPFFGWWDLNEYGVSNNSRSWYNAETVSVKHQASNDVSLYFNYTHQKAISEGSWLDTTYRVMNRQMSTGNSIKHTINVSGVVYLPFGRNRHVFTNVNRVVDEAINGWEISPVLEYYSGTPWRPGNTWEWITSAPMGVAKTTLPVDSIGHSYKRIRGVNPCVGSINADNNGVVVPSAAAVQANCPGAATASTNGTSFGAAYMQAGNYALPRNVVDFGITQPGAVRFDLAVAKNFAIPGLPKAVFSEKTNLQLRVDMLNAANHPVWDMGYNGTTSSDNWGTISKGPSAPNLNPRYLQLSARLNW
jgi:hypothetical protein